MKKLTGWQTFFIVIGVIAVIFIIMNWNKLFGKSEAAIPGGERVVGNANLTAGERLVIGKLKRDTSSFGVSERNINSSEARIRQAVDNANQSFRNIGSSARAEYVGNDPMHRQTGCSKVALNKGCTGYAGILFGTVCITWGCDKG